MTLSRSESSRLSARLREVPPPDASGSRDRAGRIRQGVYITFLVTLPAMTIRRTPSAAEGADHPAQLGDADELERLAEAAQLLGRLVADADAGDAQPLPPRRLGEEDREPAAPGQQADRVASCCDATRPAGRRPGG